MRKFIKWVIMIIIVAAIAAMVVLAMMPQPVSVDVATVTTAPMQVTVDEEGKTRIRERYVVSSPLKGRLRRITLDPGDPVVKQKTVLTVLEPTNPEMLDARAISQARSRVQAAEAAVKQAQALEERALAANTLAKTQYERISRMFANNAATESENDDAQTNLRQTTADVRAAAFGKEIANYELDVAQNALLYSQGQVEGDINAGMSIFSPIDGVVLRVFQESMSIVNPGEPLLEVGDPTDLELVIDVLSIDAANIEPGQRVIVEHWGKPYPLEAVVQRVEPSGFTKISALGIEEQRVNVIADLVTPPARRSTLGDGFRIEARIITWEGSDVLQIPMSASIPSGDKWAVYVIENNVAKLRQVSLGRENSQVNEVLEGLKQGDRVVLHPSDQLADGVKVEERELLMR